MKPERTKEEILKDITFVVVDVHGEPHNIIYPEDALKAMEEYKSQSSPVESKWVSVEIRLPKSTERVLCLTREFRRMIENSWMEHTDQDSEWFKRHFSYWRTLPELPHIEEPKEK